MVDREDLHWDCEQCEKLAIVAVRTDKESEERCASYVSNITHRLENIECNLDEKAGISSVKKLEMRASTLEESSNDTCTNTQAQSGKQGLSVSDTIAEQREREHRASNIVIYNIPESNCSETEDRIREDLSTVRSILKVTGIEGPNVVEKCIRLGKKDKGKSRVTKVMLKDKGIRAKILKRAKTLKDVEDFNKVYAGPDLTKMQRKEHC
jgi:hypothetical protein